MKDTKQFLQSSVKMILPPIIAIGLSLVVCGIIIALMGFNPLKAYIALYNSAFGGRSAIGTTIERTFPLLIGGLAITIAYRAEIFNIGIEGQIAIGGTFAAMMTTTFTGLPAFLHLPLGIAAGIVGGMIFAFLPAWLKAIRGINEVIVTLLMNYVAALIISWAVRGPLRAPGQLFAKSAPVVDAARLPILNPAYRLSAAIFVALILLVLGYFFLWHTVTGFRIRFVGVNQRAAEAGGVHVPTTILLAMLVSGGLGGMAGALHLQSTEYRMLETFMVGYGYDSIAVALVGQLHPLGVLLGGIFFGALRSGSLGMQIMVGIPSTLVYVIQGIIILFVLASYQVRLTGRRVKKAGV